MYTEQQRKEASCLPIYWTKLQHTARGRAGFLVSVRHIAGERTEFLGLLGDLPIPWEEGRGGAELNIVVRSPFEPFRRRNAEEVTRRYGWY